MAFYTRSCVSNLYVKMSRSPEVFQNDPPHTRTQNNLLSSIPYCCPDLFLCVLLSLRWYEESPIHSPVMRLFHTVTADLYIHYSIRCFTVSLFWCAHQTSNTLSWTLYHLARDAEIQKRLYDEVISVCPKGEMPTTDHLSRMPYMKAIIKETLR